jgi:hypothetical protein
MRCLKYAKRRIAISWPQVPGRATKFEAAALIAVTLVCEMPELIGAYKLRGWLVDRIFSRELRE